jgi:PAS domain S-box-containing protein
MTKDVSDPKSNPAKIADEMAPSAKKRLESAEYNPALADNSSYKAKQSLAAASRPLATLVKTFDEFLLELDADGTFLGMWSSSQPLTTGRQAEFLGQHAMEVLGDEAFRPFREVFHHVIATRERDEIEFPVDLNDGRHWFNARVLPVARRFGKAPSVSLITRDITVQKKTEDRLRKSEALLAHAEQLVNMGSWEIDVHLQTMLCSDNLHRILGLDYQGCHIDLQEIMRNVHPEDAIKARVDLQDAIAEGKHFEHDLRYVSPHGGQRNLHERGFPFHDAEGRVVRVVGVTEDVTDRLKVEERLRRSLSDQLLTIRDEEQRRLARDLHETVSQEMAALKMALASVGKTLPTRNKVGKQFLQSAREFADGVIQQIRTLSYLLHPLLLEKAGLASALRWYASGFAERSGIKVKVVMKGGFGRLPKETEISVFRIVQEGLTNVHRHSKSRVATIRLARANKTVHLEVIDRGVGMALPSAATGWNSPLGIGIAGMRERVKQLGGVFEIQSEPGHGTTIRVELPVGESSQASAEKQEKLPRFENSVPSAKSARAASAGN